MTVYGALYKAVHKAPSGLSSEQIADALGKSLSSLTYEVNPLYPSRKFGVESLAPLMLAAQDFTALHLIAAECGHAAVPLPKVSQNHRAVHEECLKSVGAFGELMEQCSRALEDGRITQEESDQLADAGYNALRGILSLLQTVQRTAR